MVVMAEVGDKASDVPYHPRKTPFCFLPCASSQMYRTRDRKGADKRRAVLREAAAFLDRMNRGERV